jgi:hypothetical protein
MRKLQQAMFACPQHFLATLTARLAQVNSQLHPHSSQPPIPAPLTPIQACPEIEISNA